MSSAESTQSHQTWVRVRLLGRTGIALLTPTPSDAPAIASLPIWVWLSEWAIKHTGPSVSEETDLNIFSFTRTTARSLGKLGFINLFFQKSAWL